MDWSIVIGVIASFVTILGMIYGVTTCFQKLLFHMRNDPVTIDQQLLQATHVLDSLRQIQRFATSPDLIPPLLDGCISRAEVLRRRLQACSYNGTDPSVISLWKTCKYWWQDQEIRRRLERLHAEEESLQERVHDTINISSHLPSSVVQREMERTVAQGAIELSRLPGPSTSRKIILVPNIKVPQFFGRHEVLARIHRSFVAGYASESSTIVTISGLAGEGKSQLALEYCYRAQQAGINRIFWIDAGSQDSIVKCFKRIAESLRFPVQSREGHAVAREVLAIFEKSNHRYLMVFDGYDLSEIFSLSGYIPRGGKGQILVTSRDHGIAVLQQDTAIKLEGLDEAAALALLSSRSGKHPNVMENVKAKMLLQRLSYHAMAISRAGLIIATQDLNFKDFMDSYERQKGLLLRYESGLQEHQHGEEDGERNSSLTLFALFEASYQHLKRTRNGNITAKMLKLFVLLDFRDISEQLFTGSKHSVSIINNYLRGGSIVLHDPRASHALLIDCKDTFDMLIRLSFSKKCWLDARDFIHTSLHPVFCDWIKYRSRSATLRSRLVVILDILIHNVNELNYAEGDWLLNPTFEDSSSILRHIQAYSRNLDELFSKSPGMKKEFYETIQNRHEVLRDFTLRVGNFRQAQELAERVVDWRRSQLIPRVTQIARDMMQLSQCLCHNFKYLEAEKICRDIEVINNGNNMRSVADDQALKGVLACALEGQQKYREAYNYRLILLDFHNDLLGSCHPMTVHAVDALATNLCGQRRYHDAEDLSRASLKKLKHALMCDRRRLDWFRIPEKQTSAQTDRVESVWTPNNAFSSGLKSTTELQILTIIKERQNLIILASLLHAEILMKQNKFEKAVMYFSEALVMCEQMKQTDTPELIRAASGLSQVHHIQGNTQRAFQHAERALKASEGRWGHDHSLTKSLRAQVQSLKSSIYTNTIPQKSATTALPALALGVDDESSRQMKIDELPLPKYVELLPDAYESDDFLTEWTLYHYERYKYANRSVVASTVMNWRLMKGLKYAPLASTMSVLAVV